MPVGGHPPVSRQVLQSYNALFPPGALVPPPNKPLSYCKTQATLEMFAETRLVLPVADRETFVLGREPETISIKDILDYVRHSGKKIKISSARSEKE